MPFAVKSFVGEMVNTIGMVFERTVGKELEAEAHVLRAHERLSEQCFAEAKLFLEAPEEARPFVDPGVRRVAFALRYLYWREKKDRELRRGLRMALAQAVGEDMLIEDEGLTKEERGRREAARQAASPFFEPPAVPIKSAETTYVEERDRAASARTTKLTPPGEASS